MESGNNMMNIWDCPVCQTINVFNELDSACKNQLCNFTLEQATDEEFDQMWREITTEQLVTEIKGDKKEAADDIYMQPQDFTTQKCEENFYCTLCMEEFKIDVVYRTDDCCKEKFCLSCIQDYLKSEIDKCKSKIECPNCSEELGQDMITTFIDGEYARKFVVNQRRAFDKAIQETLGPDEKLIYCPRAECNDFCKIQNTKDFKQFTCDVCGLTKCSKCEDQHPNDITCDQHRNKDQEQIKASEKYLKQLGCQKCPVCGQGAEHIRACMYMTCNSNTCKNKTYFCYVCGDDITKIQYGHWAGQSSYEPKNCPNYEKINQMKNKE